jgi:hypothetical protein
MRCTSIFMGELLLSGALTHGIAGRSLKQGLARVRRAGGLRDSAARTLVKNLALAQYK